MPMISQFLDIRTTMHYDDYGAPQLQAAFEGHKAIVDISNCCVIKGSLPNRQLRLVLAWIELRKDELMHNWELVRDAEELQQVRPLA